MSQLKEKIEKLHYQDTYKVELLFEMSQIVRDRSFDMFSIYVTEDIWGKDDIFMRFNRRAVEFIQLREKLMSLDLSDPMREEFRKAMDIIRKTQPLQEELIENMIAGHEQAARREMVETDLPLEFELYKVFDSLILMASNEAKQAQTLLEKKYQLAIYMTLAFAILIVFITVIIMRSSMQRIQANEQSISWDAVHDHLTRAYNRRWLNEYLSTHTVQNQEQHALLYIDLDNFKPINDQFGHSAGDKVLISVVNVFRRCVRKNDDIVRLGGDEFVILLKNCSRNKSAEIAENILRTVSHYRFSVNSDVITDLGCSIGIAFIDQFTGWQQALEIADAQCNKVKQAGKKQIAIV